MTYKIWKPEHDGHAPPNWREGMECRHISLCTPALVVTKSKPAWLAVDVFVVPAEALNSPNDDDAEFVEAWKRNEALKKLTRLGQEADALEAISLVRKLPADFLAKHGITLAPEKDWATELWADALNESGRIVAANDVRKGIFDDNDRAAIELLRTRFEQMKGER